MFPPLPFVAEPVDIAINPLVPQLAVPDVNFKNPLIPKVPASMDRTTTPPLDVAVPTPVESEIEPPVPLATGVLVPALMIV